MVPEKKILSVAQKYRGGGTVSHIEPFGSGNVNDTYLVGIEGGSLQHFVLQRINQQVFHRPKYIAANLRAYTTHVQMRLRAERGERRWETPQIVCTEQGADFVEDEHGEFWRALSLIEGTQSFGTVLNAKHAEEAGYALARFHSLVSDLDPNRLHDTLEGFHITPKYLEQFDQICLQTQVGRADPDVRYCFAFIEGYRQQATVLEEAKSMGALKQRTIHGDPKIDNILIDDVSQRAVSIVDLDTVKPGLIHYDVGDCLRSCCNPLGEETDQIENVRFDVDLCEIILAGYLSVARQFFQETDYAYLYECMWLISFELGLRFFTDYLAGDIYFKAHYPAHNLQRSLVQFKLAESVASQEETIRRLITSVRAVNASRSALER